MKYRRKQNGLTLTELVVVVAVVAILLGISVPTAQKIMDSFQHSAGAKGLIDAALTSARAMAVTKSKPVGIRFQKGLDGNQYMVFIELFQNPPPGVLANGFQVVEGRKPIKLPNGVGVMDGLWVARAYNGIGAFDPVASQDYSLNDSRLMNLSNNIYLNDAATFSVIFSSSGQMIYHELWVCNKQMLLDVPANPINNPPLDSMFNWQSVVDAGNAKFYQDDYGGSPHSRVTQNLGIGPEMSRRSFIIYNTKQLAETDPAARWTNYLGLLQAEFVNPYTGQLVKR